MLHVDFIHLRVSFVVEVGGTFFVVFGRETRFAYLVLCHKPRCSSKLNEMKRILGLSPNAISMLINLATFLSIGDIYFLLSISVLSSFSLLLFGFRWTLLSGPYGNVLAV